ncbi:MAG: DeoR/GlpR transcriptional regulator [Clostridiales bacterium]|nr:DeoR/GlpR transcriptional regulator [Clostridiales bacterium]
MLPEERQELITHEIKKSKYCSIVDLSTRLNVSTATIRRDLQALSASNVIRLTRGGAAYVFANTVQEPAYTVKSALHLEEKERIGLAACRLVKPGETILLDTGTTVFQMTPGLREIQNLMVATNDVLIASELASCANVSLCVLGGLVRKGYYTTTGFWTQQALESMHVDRFFLSCDAVDISGGCSITNSEEILVKQLMLNACNECYLLADHTKFESVAFIRVCGVERLRGIITGRELSQKTRQEYEAMGVQMILV